MPVHMSGRKKTHIPFIELLQPRINSSATPNMNGPNAFLVNLFVTDEDARQARETMEQNQLLMARSVTNFQLVCRC